MCWAFICAGHLYVVGIYVMGIYMCWHLYVLGIYMCREFICVGHLYVPGIYMCRAFICAGHFTSATEDMNWNKRTVYDNLQNM